MDSPETDKTNKANITSATTIADSSPIQDSPVFTYISNLSPIKPVRAAPVAPGFLGLSSPPMVFTSPHINPSKERSKPKRLQYSRSPSVQLFHQDDQGKKIVTGAEISETLNAQLSTGLISCSNECDKKCPMPDHAGSLSGCVDQYFADAAEVEGGDSANSANLCLKQPDGRNNAENVAVSFPPTLGQAEEDHLGTAVCNKTKTVDEIPSTVFPKEGDIHVERKCEHIVDQHAGACDVDDLDNTCQFKPESIQIEDCLEATAAVTREDVENLMLLDPKAREQQRTTRRRCLQFEESRQQNNLVNFHSSWSTLPADTEVSESSCVEKTLSSSAIQLGTVNPPVNSMITPLKHGSSTFILPKPSGIGLHLNSIVNAVPTGSGTTSMKSAEKGCLSIKGKKLVSVIGCHQSGSMRNPSAVLDVIEKVSQVADDGNPLPQASLAVISAKSVVPQIVKPLDNAGLLKPSDSQTTSSDKRKSYSDSVDTVEELNQLSPKKKRKKASGFGDSDGCKRCNCKKTKCLKLYCDCFAAGIYCGEACACQGCFNKPEYEDTVLETRQQIESRNPLAFAPKIVPRLVESPANLRGDDGNRSTPSSARHKRGCNCKKSMCLKKYCECYQANVGCSDGCRCEGCKNVYGQKEEYGMTKDVVSKRSISERVEGRFDEKLENVATKNGLLCSSHGLTPHTPSLQSSDHGKYPSKSRFLSGRYDPTPESDIVLLPPYAKSPGSPVSSDNQSILVKIRGSILDSGSCHQDNDILETPDEILPSDGHNMTHLSTTHDSSVALVSSTSAENKNWTNVSKDQICPRSGLQLTSSFHWRGSPVTPLTQFGGSKDLQAMDSGDSLYDMLEDDTPEILKDSSTPLNVVKVSSPNKKRVSPPRSRLHELGSSSSGVVKSGRKFILKAVPSFPPLTPCVDSNDSTDKNTKDSRDFHSIR